MNAPHRRLGKEDKQVKQHDHVTCLMRVYIITTPVNCSTLLRTTLVVCYAQSKWEKRNEKKGKIDIYMGSM